MYISRIFGNHGSSDFFNTTSKCRWASPRCISFSSTSAALQCCSAAAQRCDRSSGQRWTRRSNQARRRSWQRRRKRHDIPLPTWTRQGGEWLMFLVICIDWVNDLPCIWAFMRISNIALCIMYVVLISGRNQTQDITRRSFISFQWLHFQYWDSSSGR